MSKRGLKNQWEVESAAIMGYHTGKLPDHRALSTLKENWITNYSHRARQVRLVEIKCCNYNTKFLLIVIDTNNNIKS